MTDSMDAMTARILRENTEFDTAVRILVGLLQQAKESEAHGKTGVVAHHKAGAITHLSKITAFFIATTKIPVDRRPLNELQLQSGARRYERLASKPSPRFLHKEKSWTSN